MTFKVERAFPEGWFAYISCAQPQAQYRLDSVRLMEGEYVPMNEDSPGPPQSAQVSLFDTGSTAPIPLSGETIAKKAGWTKVAEGELAHSFQGDAVLMNDHLAVVLRREGAGAEVFGNSAEGFHLRAVATPADAPGLKLASLKIAENTADAVAVNAGFQTSDGRLLDLRYELPLGQVFVKTEAPRGVKSLRLDAPCRTVVLPDFFADDIVVDAAEIPVPQAELPSENFLLHLVGQGDAMVMSVSDSREQDAVIRLAGQGESRRITASELRFGKEGKIWLAVIEGHGVWHRQRVAKKDAGRTVRLDWQAPCPAQWRVDWRRSNGLTSSWEMLSQKANGEYEKPGWFGSASTLPSDRHRWTTVLGWFKYPCWMDRSRRGFLQPLAAVLEFEGPAVVYPINRGSGTPLDTFTVVDIVRRPWALGPASISSMSKARGRRTKGGPPAPPGTP